ncbi:Zinc finger and SCAN domain-containing protein 20 [Wickerhamomyces ciferrii]|uniref:Zinc finger and SCAN domain-containing protein 20 n=1 Tax=Wickerhamomyces ciferrii (strain ATCC 14091 / BCRC 22168 / CBS 111 / JCM 3599 / NBRC 0793 / NRRL Y-1031 F-60-10) TaxID=1206466 RepID=K0KLF0_WICCF|nr:Zinc finger and SCAN domain-containing protein 20 [Wickerhamomyces ciferrii]CCH43791.1 Zinc finger and SCAN domain-containing protein 20 [Wickerhamomyces ciferrii]
MNNLLRDPVFRQLLTNNNENSTLEPIINPQQQVYHSDLNDVKNEDISKIDFSFLDTYVPLVDDNLNNLNHVNFDIDFNNFENNENNENENTVNDLEDGSLTEDSYTPSVFSNDQVESSVGSVKEFGGDIEHDYMRKVDISNESSKQQQPLSLQPHPSHLEQQSKQFHKFYTSTFNTKGDLTTKTSISKPLLTYHKCPFCQRQFKNKSYLSRHLKKHDSIKDFKCPFFNESSSKCHHLNGEFSRKDTFKAHLKSIHFIYPIGVAKNERNSSTGRCAGCFKEFENNNIWLSEHIETDECTGFAKYKLDQEAKI